MDFDGISRPVTQLIDAGALVVFVPSLLLAVLLSGPFARRWGTSRWLTALALASVAGIIAATLRERDLLLWSEDIGAILACVGCDRFGWLTDADLWSGVTQVQVGWLLNVALFVPAGILLTLASGRPRRVLVGLIGLSFAIEVIQDLTFLGHQTRPTSWPTRSVRSSACLSRSSLATCRVDGPAAAPRRPCRAGPW